MKNHNLKIVLFFLINILFFAGCKSLPEKSTTKVNSLDLLDFTNNFYMSIPSNVDQELLQRLIQNNFSGVSEKDAKSIIDRIDHMYLGLTRNRNITTIQASADVNIPTKYVPSILSAKNGWKKSVIQEKNPDTKYDVFTQNGMDISFPSGNNCCLGKNMDFMIQQYHEIYNTPAEESEDYKFSVLPDDIYNWLSGSDDEIRFYTISPKTYLSMLIGMNIDLQLKNVWGSIRQDPKNKNILLLDFTFDFKSEAFKKAGKSLLLFTFGLTNPISESDSPTALTISGIELKKEQLYKLLVL